jgi:hypothetical protein
MTAIDISLYLEFWFRSTSMEMMVGGLELHIRLDGTNFHVANE